MELKLTLLLIAVCVLGAVNCQPCSRGQTYLNSYVNTTTESGYILTGYATVCVNGSFIPICNRSSLGFLEASSVCISMGAFGGYYGPPPAGVTLPPINITNTNRAARNFNCTGFHDECTWMAPPMAGGTCANGNAILNCINVCNENDDYTLLYNNYTAILNGINNTIGVPQYCGNGAYLRICDDGSNSANVGRLLCNSFGFQFGRTLPANTSLSSPSQGVFYLNNFMCDNNNSCNNFNVTTSEQCYNGQQDMVLACNNGRPCQNSGPFYYTNVTTISNGFEIVTGIVLNCLNGTTVALCNRNIRQRVPNLTCQQMGFIANGTIVPSNTNLYGSTPGGVVYYANLTCPQGVTNVSDCEGQNVQCPNQLRNVVIRCSRILPSTAIVVPPTPTNTRSMTVTASNPTTITSTSTSSTGTSTNPTPATSDSNTGVIVGVSVGLVVPLIGGIAIILIVLLIVFIVMKRKEPKKKSPPPVSLQSVSK